MLADLASSDRDGLLAYHVDRLTRRPIELEQLVEVLTDAKSAMFASWLAVTSIPPTATACW